MFFSKRKKNELTHNFKIKLTASFLSINKYFFSLPNKNKFQILCLKI